MTTSSPSDYRVLTFAPEVQRDLTLYVRGLFAPEDDILTAVRANTITRGLPEIAIRPEEGQMLQFLIQLVGAQRVLEIGTLAGYSGIWLARGLTNGGSLTTLELDPHHAQVAGEHFTLAGVSDRVRIVQGPALNTLRGPLVNETYDLVFIDADKEGYPDYLAWATTHVRPGGLITAHNAFRSGNLLNTGDDKANSTRAMLEHMAADPRLFATIIPVGDGIAAAIVR